MAKVLLNKSKISFKEKIFQVVAKIPRGNVLTYKQVAQLAGRPKAYRAVGNILNKNYDPQIPCHRVIRSDGKAGGYNRGGREKRKRLRNEGVDFNKIF
ncbi:MAG TPA: MGMT family protein [bacterium]|nr:MGMT family protein [bacterium]